MRRFPNASTIRYQLHRIFVTAMLAIAVLALLGKAAHAQCGDIDDQPDDVLGIFSDRFEPYVPIADAALCAKVTKTAVAACHAALSDWASCQEGVVGSSYKITKAVCATTPDPKACAASAKVQLETDRTSIATALAGVGPSCDLAFANAVLQICLEGFPS
jgi:hypothetical protein